MAGRPSVNSLGNKELDKAEEQFKAFDENVKSLTMDSMNKAPMAEVEPQTKISQQDMAKKKEIFLKPIKTISSREPFNEKYRAQYEFAKEYVQFISENKEVIGEDIEPWTKPFAGMPAEQWRIPTNKPVWGPRYLAEQIRRKTYHTIVMTKSYTETDGMGQYFGSMAAEKVVARLTAEPVSSNRSVFMGAGNF